MKLLIDFFPIILFFATFKTWGIMVATAVAIAATVLQIGYLWRKNGFVEPMQWVSLGVIVVFGGATLLGFALAVTLAPFAGSSFWRFSAFARDTTTSASR